MAKAPKKTASKKFAKKVSKDKKPPKKANAKKVKESKASARKPRPESRPHQPAAAIPPTREFGPAASAFSRMSVEHFADLIRSLIREEATSLGVPATEFVALDNAFTQDGGIDAELRRAPARAGGFLPAKQLVAQFKRGDLSLAKARAEVSKHDRVRELVTSGYAYRLILGVEHTGARLAELKEALVSEFKRKKIDGPDLDVDVLSASQLADWVAEYPPLSGHVALRAAGEPSLSDWLSLSGWQGADHEFPWQGEGGRNEEVKRLAERLQSPRAVVRVIGPPGAGKSRYVLEAVKLAGFGERTLYSPHFHEGLRNLLTRGAGVARRKCVLVVDECTSQQAQQFEAYRHPEADVRIVSIGSADEIRAYSTDPRVVVLQPLKDVDAERVAADRLAPGIKGHAAVIASRGDGYPKLIALICEVLGADPEAFGALAVGQHERLVSVLKRLLGSRGTGEPVQALCLPRQYGFEGKAAGELAALAKGTGTEFEDLIAAHEALQRRALIGRTAEYAYVTPYLLAEWLAGDLWSNRGAALFLRLREAGLADRGLRSTLRRLIDLGMEPGTTEVAAKLLASPDLFRDVTDLDEDARASFVDELATLNPKAAGRLLRRLLRSESRERLLTIDAGRRHVVWALQKCAWAAESFEDAAWSLLGLAAAENENYGNNATGVLRSLFLTHLGSTEATGELRVAWLKAAWAAATGLEQAILLGVAERALEMEGAGEANPFPDALGRPERWVPANWEEEDRYRKGVASIVAAGIELPDGEVRLGANRVVGRVLRALLARDHWSIALGLVEAMGEAARSDADLARAIIHVKSYDLRRISPAAREATARLERLLEPVTLSDRLANALRVAEWEGNKEVVRTPDFDKLAQEFIDNANADANWAALEGADPSRLFEFGQALGRSDSKQSLRPLLLGRVDRPNFLRLLAAYAPLVPATGMDAGGDDLLDAWAREPDKARVALEASWLGEPTIRAAARIAVMLERKALPEDEFGRLRYGGWLLRLPEETALGVLGKFGGASVGFLLAFQMWHHTKSPSAGVAAMAREFWLRLVPADVPRGHGEWEWTTFGESLARSAPAEAARAAIKFISVPEPIEGAANLVAIALEAAPDAVWPELSSLLTDGENPVASRLARALAGKVRGEAAVNVVVRWAQEGPKNVRMAARLMGPPGPAGAASLANALLEAFPGRDEVIQEATRTFFSGAFWGPASDHYRAVRDGLLDLAKQAGPGLRAWAGQAVRVAESYMEFGEKLDATHKLDP